MGNGGGLCVCVKRSVFSAIKSWRDERTALQATQTDTHTLSPPPQSFISRSLENNFSESCCSLRNNFAYPSSLKRLHVYVIQMTHQFSFLLKTNLIIISFIFPKIRIRIQLLIYVLCSVATLLLPRWQSPAEVWTGRWTGWKMKVSCVNVDVQSQHSGLKLPAPPNLTD